MNTVLLKALRILNGDTLQDLADYLGINRSTLCLKENNKYKFTAEEANKISKKYNVSVDVLLSNDIKIQFVGGENQ